MIQKLLIANRGEIACRIMRTCRKMGIRTVAVFSDADAGALHVALADEAVHVGPAEAARSYLDVGAILAAAKSAGADAIHPGYGFLSERVALAEGCAKLGIAWVGPSPRAIEQMGSKIESKRLAEAVGVASVPGYHGDAQDDEALEKAATKIGFPVLIKASAGGGGRGMRRVESAKDLKSALALARAEAKAGFGDASLLIEKLIRRPRHLEVQLAGDKHGNLIHLFERECSIQRNYQKVIEEAPAPNLAPEIRTALFDAALKLGRAIGYDSLGTVEFILDADARAGAGGPWFLEMNTRLQVEHPVTEEITGLDLVELQIRVAQGEALPFAQDRVTASGAAIEARLNAEDPAAAYRPSFGKIAAFDIPSAEGVRIDTGIRPGSEVTPHYDSMIAKVIAAGPEREIAAMRLSAALSDTAVLGIGTNQAFLKDIVGSARFRSGNLSTRFLEEVWPDGWKPPVDGTLPDYAVAAVAWADSVERRNDGNTLGPWHALGGFRILAPASRRAQITLAVAGDGETRVELSGAKGSYELIANDTRLAITVSRQADALAVVAGGVVRKYRVAVDENDVSIAHEGRSAGFRVAPVIERASGKGGADDGAGETRVTASLPGLISAIHVAEGQEVAKGDVVVVIEAMKLMHGLPAQIGGRVSAIFCRQGETVTAGTVLVEIEVGESA